MKPRDIRLIGLDLDGTVLNSKKQITPRTLEAIQKAIAAGIMVMPATGRPLSGVDSSFLQIPGVEYALTSNGASVYRLSDRQLMFSDCFTHPKAVELLKILLEYKAMTSVQMDGQAYVRSFDGDVLNGVIQWELVEYFRKTRVVVPDLIKHVEESGHPVEKFSLVFHQAEELRRATETMQSRDDNCVTSSLTMNLEINTPSANKGTAMLALGQKLGIPKECIMGVGDSGNDYEMLRQVGYGVAMGNADERVKSVADAVTAGCDEDGVALAIEAIL